MTGLSPSSRIVLDVVVALALVPMVVECLWGVRAAVRARRLGSIARPVTAVIIAAWLSAAFVWPQLTGDASVDSRAGLIVLARAAQAGHWPGQPLQSVVNHARGRQGVEDLAELLALVSAGRPAWSARMPDALFSGGARLDSAQRASAPLEGWSAHDAGAGRCQIILYFRADTAFSGGRLWLHAYPDPSHDYVDVPVSLPARDWAPDDFGWEVFQTAGRGAFTLYAGVRKGTNLGPAVRLGHVDRCVD